MSIVEKLRKFASRTNSECGKDIDMFKEDLAFVGGNQSLKADNKFLDKRNKMVFNITRQYCNQGINAYRRDPFKPSFMPRTSDMKDIAVAIDGFFQAWLDGSDFLPATCTSVDRQYKAGVGYAMMYNDYVDEGFEQDVFIKALARPDLVMYGRCSSVTGRDVAEVGVVEHISYNEAKARYGDVCDWENIESPLTETKWQAPEDCVEIVKYFVLNKKAKRLYQNEAGEALEYTDDMEEEGFKPKKMRKLEETSVTCYTICGDYVVDETELKLSRIPIVRYFGELVDDIDGHQHPVGMVYFAKDPQRLINWTGSTTGERMLLSPKPTKYVDMKSIANYKGIWAKANTTPTPYLPFDSTDASGKALLPPQDSNPTANISDTLSAQSNYQGLLSSIMGMPEQGAITQKGFQQTAAEVLTQNKSSEVSNYQFVDNAKEATKELGRLWLEFAFIVYDTQRLLPSKEGQSVTMRSINFAEIGIKPSQLDISVDAGPMQATQMQETMNSLFALGSMLGPEATLVFSDDIVKNTKFKGSEEVAKKLSALSKAKTGIGGDPNEQQDPEAMQALAKADETVQVMQGRIDQLQAYIGQMQVESQVAQTEAQAKIITQQMSDATKVYIKELEINANNAQMMAKISADYEAQQEKARIEMMKLYAGLQAKAVTIAPDQNPSLNAVNGMQNTMYKY